ncbi:RNA polymerase sigma factor SigJ [Bacillus sp. RG28]|uniref:RNA polymerase sigma factor SigJ n=1 Tax=Gottfriedia endophytica TaxID=2820819 RepID=A0A940NRW0_9BACI|nr:RNA polymerase sigma factor SigJ [Gottfriedia endophytica]MBP0725711.1 RNA polymerase sigma factor SigJ [Gottfriedia endophytica]
MDNELLNECYIEYKRLLFSLAYQLTGSICDAEDVIQDVFAQLSTYDLKHQTNMKGFLCKLVTNRCFDLIKSARKKRELYVGTWLPEPLIVEEDPLYEISIENDVSLALLLLFEKLNPTQRAIFILREVLEFDYKTIAEIVQKEECTCRKIFSRVKNSLPNIEEELSTPDNHEKVIKQFIGAFQQGNVNQIIDILQHDIVYYADGGGKTVAALRPIFGIERVGKLLESLMNKIWNEDIKVSLGNVNGRTGIIFQDAHGLKGVVGFNIKQDKIKEIYFVANPDKLKVH